MAEVGIKRTPTYHKRASGDFEQQWIDEGDSWVPQPDAFPVPYHDPFDDYVAESWLPQTSPSWNRSCSPRNTWSHDSSSGQRPLPAATSAQEQESILYPDTRSHVTLTSSQTPFVGQDYHVTAPHSENSHAYQPQPCMHVIDQVPQESGETYPSQTPETIYHRSKYSNSGTSSFQLQPNGYSNLHGYGAEFIEDQVSWPTPTGQITSQKLVINTDLQHPVSPNQPSSCLKLDWSICDQSLVSINGGDSRLVAAIPKRKASKEVIAHSSSPVEAPQLSECVDVFENAPGALASVKRRKKLDAPVRKAAREVRKAGACHQCQFRKRTCSTGTPCNSCLKNGNSLHEIKCQRESPFIGKLMHQYFEHSSTRRIMCFDITIPLADVGKETVTIDGVGKISYPLQLRARRTFLSEFSSESKNMIRQTEDSRHSASSQEDPIIMVLEDNDDLGTQIEQWALEYTSKYVHAAGPKFYSTTLAQILGTVYVQRGLPESALVAAMLRVASLAFILRAGVKYTTKTSSLASSSPSKTQTQSPLRYRTIQAKVDTILYHRLKLAEKDLFQRLQRLIFRSAGCLAREQIYPVALVLWQLLRFLCISTSHLSNIAQRFQSIALGPADYQHHGLKLMLSTHMALFRSSNPLLLDMKDKFNQDLVGGDSELIGLAVEMTKVVGKLRKRGCREMKGSITYRKEYFDLWRQVYEGK